MRGLMILSIAGALAAQAGCSESGPEAFRAVVIADSHITGPQYECCRENGTIDNASIQRVEERLAEVVARINEIRPAPDMVFMLGDVMHDPFYSLEREYYDTTDTAWNISAGLLAGIDVPVYPLWGNHDYHVRCNRDAADTVSVDMTHEMFGAFFDAEPYYALDHRGWKFILANSQLGPTWQPGNPRCDTGQASYGPEQLGWIDAQLGEGLPTMFMTHNQMLVTEADEDPDAFNPDLETVLNRYAADNLALTMVGHTHRWIDWEDAYEFPHYVIGATRYDADNFWLLEFADDGTYSILDYDKLKRFSTCASTYSYDGDPERVVPQPPEDGDC